jgi:hypothetical protein
MMGIEAFVFRSQDRSQNVRRNFIEGQLAAEPLGHPGLA